MQDLYGLSSQTQSVAITNQNEVGERCSSEGLPTSGSSPPPETLQNIKMEQTETKELNQINETHYPLNMSTTPLLHHDTIKSETPEEEYQCQTCSMTFTSLTNMHRHMRVAHEDSSSRTDDSGTDEFNKRKRLKRRYGFNNNKGLKRANEEEIRRRLKIPRGGCPVCKREDFASVNVLEMHLEEAHPEYQIKCVECNLGFKNHRVLNLHRYMVHSEVNTDPDVVQNLTYIDFSSQKFPVIAQKMCENGVYKGTDEFQCGRCSRNFPCGSALEMHQQTCLLPNQVVTSSSDSENDEEFKRRKNFFAGLNLLTKREDLPTTIPDGRDLADIQSIISVTNTGLKQIKGAPAEPHEEEQDVFAAEFRKMKLRGEFPCRLCTAIFPNLRALKGHNRAHLTGNGGIPYRCNMCPHSSSDKAALIRHMRTHNGDRPYECALCNYAFTTKANCERHLRNRHRKVTRDDVKRSIIYHPSEDPTNDENLSKTPTKPHDIPKRTLFPNPESTNLPIQIPDFRAAISKYQDFKPTETYPKLATALNLTIPEEKPKIQVKQFAQLAIPDLINTPVKSDSESEYGAAPTTPIDLSMDVLDLSKKKPPTPEPVPEDLSTKSYFDKTQFLLAQQLLKRTNPFMYRTPPQTPFINPYFLQPHPFLTPTASPQDLQEMKERIQKEILRGLQLSSGGGLIMNEDTPVPEIPNVEPPKTPTILQHTPNSVKMVIKNGVLMPKQKQRRYRTERPFSCEHCSARFTLRSNMERHIKQQHPQFWSQRQRSNIAPGIPGRKPSTPIQPPPINPITPAPNLLISEQVKFAILASQLKQFMPEPPPEDDEESTLIIDENSQDSIPPPTPAVDPPKKSLEQKMIELRMIREKILLRQQEEQDEKERERYEEAAKNEDLVPVSKLLDNAAVQIPFREYFRRDSAQGDENGEFTGPGSEEDEEGLVASGSTSEGNISGSDGNRSETENNHKNAQNLTTTNGTQSTTTPADSAPVKKKSAYSLAPNRVTCPYCHRKFPWSSSLRRHILTHTGQKPFKCSHCPLLFTTKSNCDRHLLRKHGNITPSPNPPVEVPTLQNNYMMRNVPERPFKCSTCPSSTFSTLSNLKKHMSCKHQDGSSYDSSPSEDDDVKVEVDVIQSSDLPFKCHLCDSSYADRQVALDHIKDQHYTEYELLMSKGALETNNNQEVEQSDQDEVRGKFPDYANRKVMCAFCMRRFWSAEDLRRHMRTHTGERPFSCDVCRRRFTLKHSMLRHRKKHNSAQVSDEDDIKNNNNKSEFSENGDLISNLLGIRDSSIIEQVLRSTPDDAAKLLGVNKTD